MAEGIEETETNSSSGAGDATASFGAAMPCEVHEFESYHNQAIKRSVSTSPTPKIMPHMQQSVRKLHEQSNDFEPISQHLQQHRLHSQRKSIASKRKHSTDTEENSPKQKQSQQPQQSSSSSQHEDDLLSQSSCSPLASVSPPLRKFKTEVCLHFKIIFIAS